MNYRVETCDTEAKPQLWYGWTFLKGLGNKILIPEEIADWQAYCLALPKPKRSSDGRPTELWMTPEGYAEFERIEPIWLKVRDSSQFTGKRILTLAEFPAGSTAVYRDAHYVLVAFPLPGEDLLILV